MNRKFNGQDGMTLVELLIATLILLPLFISGLYTFVKCTELSETAATSSQAVLGLKNQMTAIENTQFSQVEANYNNTNFDVAGIQNGEGVVYVDDGTADQLEVVLSFCWRTRSGRIIGEDANLNGQLDAGEDTNGNGRIDSQVQLMTILSNI